MTILHPLTAELHEHQRYQRRLMASGIIPPLEATKPRRCECGWTWDPGRSGVTRVENAGRVRWVSACPACDQQQTTYRRED